MTSLSLLLTSKQVHDEFVDTLQRKSTTVIYLYTKNTPEYPNGFKYDIHKLFTSRYLGAVRRLIVLAKWHTGENWKNKSMAPKTGIAHTENSNETDNTNEVSGSGTYDQSIIKPVFTSLTKSSLDCSKVAAALLTTVKDVLARLLLVDEVDITFDAGNSSIGHALRTIYIDGTSHYYTVYSPQTLQVKTLLEWRPAFGDELERISHITKTVLVRPESHLPLRVEERRRRDVSEEHGEWWNAKDETPDMLEVSVSLQMFMVVRLVY
jgi:hypothetical protein